MTKEKKKIIELEGKNEKAMHAILDSIPIPDALHHGPAIAFTHDKKKKKENNKGSEKDVDKVDR